MDKQHSTGLKRPLQGANSTNCSKKERKEYSSSDISDEDLEKLKCSKCDGYLSCSFVKIKEENDNVCGRCTGSMTNLRGYTRNIVYETLAKKKLFPCNNQTRGCTEKILFNNVLHEEYCKFRAYLCPERTCFEKNLTKDEMVKHYHNRHRNSIFENNIILNLEMTWDEELSALINTNDNLFVACIKTFHKKYVIWLCVRCIGSPELLENYHYNIEIFNSSCSNTSFKEDRKLLLPYKNDFLEKDTAQHINLRSIFKKCGTSIRLKITIGKNFHKKLKLPAKEIKLAADQIPAIASTSRMDVETNKAMLQSKNIEEFQRLPSTSGMQDSGKGANHTNQMQVEPILTKCKNKECMHFGNRQNLQKHEKYFCPYNRKCFACDNNTHAQFKSHLQKMHSYHMIESSSIKMIPKINDWWMMTTIDKPIYYCKIIEKENNLYVQITTNQDKNSLDKFVFQVNNYYMLPDKVNDNSLVDWEIKLDTCKKLDRNKNIYLKFIGIKKE